VDGVDHLLEINALLPQAVGARSRECLALTDVGGCRVVAYDAHLRIVIAVIAMQCEHAVADVALRDVHYYAPRDRGGARDIPIADRTGHGYRSRPGPVVTTPGGPRSPQRR